MAIEEKREKDFERAFEELYVVNICMAKKNKELKEHLEAITKEKYVIKEELWSKEGSSHNPRLRSKSSKNNL